ncbi:MAG TPA: SAM-dependent methyltransferase [Candidatus Limnocylindrales bacterium]|nr:SAM-dependent methyltransferase [Candidatus Limnocylindrales bacterium]
MDLRRVPAPARDVASDPALVAAIREEIERAGPMTFARFMEIALYDTARGYYRGVVARPGRAGDFLTAPEASPIFGRTLARFARGVHAAIGAPGAFTIREHGAGTGALAAPLVTALLANDGGPNSIDYLVAEIEPARVEAVRVALADRPRVTVEPDDGRSIDGLVLANEVLDALPTHRVVRRSGRLREILVAIGSAGELTDIEVEPTTATLADRLAAEAVELADGQHAEICVAVDGWIERAAAGLARGVLLLIDYGHPAADLYDPRRRAAGTLATYLGHQVAEDPYRAIGRQDITAHVDISAVERAAVAAGLDHLGTTTQAEFLSRLGAGELLVAEQTGPGASLQGYLETRSALVRMIDPGAMGRFRVMAFGRGLGAGALPPGFEGRS